MHLRNYAFMCSILQYFVMALLASGKLTQGTVVLAFDVCVYMGVHCATFSHVSVKVRNAHGYVRVVQLVFRVISLSLHYCLATYNRTYGWRLCFISNNDF